MSLQVVPRIRESEQCRGYSADHRRCKLQREQNQPTCRIHRNYFPSWFETHKAFRGIHFLRDYSMHHLRPENSREIREHFAFFQNFQGVVPASYLLKLTPIVIVDMRYFVWISQWPSVHPLQHKEMLKSIVNNFIDITVHEPFAHIMHLIPLPNDFASRWSYSTIIAEYLSYLTWNPEVTIRLYTYTIKKLIRTLLWIYTQFVWNQVHGDFATFCRPCIQALLGNEMWRSLYGSPLWRKTPLRYESLFAGRDPKFQELILKKILLPSLHEIRDQQRELLKARCAVFKEELMMNRWHPTRIQKFMDDGILSDME